MLRKRRYIPFALSLSKGFMGNALIDLILHSWFDKLTTNGGLNQRLPTPPASGCFFAGLALPD